MSVMSVQEFEALEKGIEENLSGDPEHDAKLFGMLHWALYRAIGYNILCTDVIKTYETMLDFMAERLADDMADRLTNDPNEEKTLARIRSAVAHLRTARKHSVG